MKLNDIKCFNLMVSFVKNNHMIEPKSLNWEVSDLLSGMDMFSEFKKNISSPTMDPAYWYDWKELVEESLARDSSILDEENGLTLEQGLVAIQYLLHHRYWVKDNNMLLKDAYADLMQEYNANIDNLESSQLWREWLAAVEEGRKFNKVFKGEIKD